MNKILAFAMSFFGMVTLGHPATADTICVHVVVDASPLPPLTPLHECPQNYNGPVLCAGADGDDLGPYVWVEICVPDPVSQPKTAR
jgi:hypothetical protein